jgi:hypothetical protein
VVVIYRLFCFADIKVHSFASFAGIPFAYFALKEGMVLQLPEFEIYDQVLS